MTMRSENEASGGDDIKDGDRVRVPELGCEGVLELLGDGRCRVTADSGTSVRTAIENVVKL